MPLPTPYYQDDHATIYHADCMDILPSLAGIDLVFTSPPYNLSTTTGGGFGHYSPTAGMAERGGGSKWDAALADGYDGHDDAMTVQEYERWQRSVVAALWGTLTDDGAIFYNHKPRVQAKELWMPTRLVDGFPIRQIVIWARAGGMNFAPTHYVPTHEWIIVVAKDGWRLTSRGASGIGDVWRVPQETDNGHPAPFPIGLPARAIETSGPSIVLDPFMGSGTTLRAAKDAGCRSIGIEKSESYCEIAARRLGQEVLAFT